MTRSPLSIPSCLRVWGTAEGKQGHSTGLHPDGSLNPTPHILNLFASPSRPLDDQFCLGSARPLATSSQPHPPLGPRGSSHAPTSAQAAGGRLLPGSPLRIWELHPVAGPHTLLASSGNLCILWSWLGQLGSHPLIPRALSTCSPPLPPPGKSVSVPKD